MNPDCENCNNVIKNLIEKNGEKESLSICLMGLGNIIKSLSENVSEEKFNQIMKDPLIAICANFSLRLMEAGEMDLKKHGIRK